MRNRFHELAIVLGAAAVAVFIAPASRGNEAKLTSPDGKVQFTLVAQREQLRFEVASSGATVIESSPLTITLDGDDITASAEIGEVMKSLMRETYAWRGVHSQATNHFNGATVALHCAKTNSDYTLEVRAFNDGVAFRYLVPENGKARIPDEATLFTLPAGSIVWHHDL